MNEWQIGLAGILVMLACFTSQTAAAQTIESLVMPGEVIQGHADIETECTSCHKRFDRSAQSGLCLDCHEDVANDTNAGIGFHGRSTACTHGFRVAGQAS
jgi:uncharacterized paraquat-inducible protein A